MIHYHGTPITPLSVLHELAGRHFCVSFAHPGQVRHVHEIGQSVMLDNGAFSFWRTGKPVDWDGYYRWTEKWLVYPTTWAVIPDMIDGTPEDNDALIDAWPHGDRGAPVWHLHEPIERLVRLASNWSRVCVGSSGEFRMVATPAWHGRMRDAMAALCGDHPVPVWLHMLRGMRLAGDCYPFASVDSTDIARNHHRPMNTAREMADRWDSMQCPAHWLKVASCRA